MFLTKILSAFNENSIFSLTAGEKAIPVRALAAYQVPGPKIAQYQNQGWEEMSAGISLSRELFREKNRNNDPKYYLQEKEMLMFLFYAAQDKKIEQPYGFNCFEHQSFQGENYIYISRIENYYKATHRGIGRATVAQAAYYYFQLYPNAPEYAIALKLDPLKENEQQLTKLYASYGFETDIISSMFMTVGKTRCFLQDYYQRLNKYLSFRS